MNDWLIKSTHLREFGVDVQRVAIAGKPVDGRLVRRGLVLDRVVGRALRRNVLLGGARSAVTTKAAFTAKEDAGRVGEQHVSALILRIDGNADERAGALVVNARDRAAGRQLAAGRYGAMQRDALLAVEEHHRIELDVLADTAERGEGRDYAERRQRLEVLLVDEVQLVRRRADAQGVEHDVAFGVLKRGFGEFFADGRSVDGHKLFLLSRAAKLQGRA